MLKNKQRKIYGITFEILFWKIIWQESNLLFLRSYLIQNSTRNNLIPRTPFTSTAKIFSIELQFIIHTNSSNTLQSFKIILKLHFKNNKFSNKKQLSLKRHQKLCPLYIISISQFPIYKTSNFILKSINDKFSNFKFNFNHHLPK